MCHKERPSKIMTFGERIIFLALTILKTEATSGFTGSRGHEDQAMSLAERPSTTLTFGKRSKFLALTILK